MKVLIGITVMATLGAFCLAIDQDFSGFTWDCNNARYMFDKDRAVPDPHNCYFMCIAESLHLFDRETGFRVDGLYKEIAIDTKKKYTPEEKEELPRKIQKCIDDNPKQTNRCVWASNTYNCITKLSNDLSKNKSEKVSK